jgi:hypothetical protein
MNQRSSEKARATEASAPRSMALIRIDGTDIAPRPRAASLLPTMGSRPPFLASHTPT